MRYKVYLEKSDKGFADWFPELPGCMINCRERTSSLRKTRDFSPREVLDEKEV